MLIFRTPASFTDLPAFISSGSPPVSPADVPLPAIAEDEVHEDLTSGEFVQQQDPVSYALSSSFRSRI